MNERRSHNLDAVLAAAAAPPLPEEEDPRALADVLTMFNTAGIAAEAGVAATEPITADSAIEPTAPVDPRSVRGAPRLSFAMKCAVAFVFVLGASIAISSAGILPSPVQSFVHHVFGGIGVPAPTQTGTTPSGNGSAPANPSPIVSTRPDSVASASATSGSKGGGAPTAGAPGPGVASASPSATEASLYTLCTEVKGSGNSWKTTMSAQDQARLVAAAGGENKVHAYCNQLLQSSTSSYSSTVAPSPSPSPSVTASATD